MIRLLSEEEIDYGDDDLENLNCQSPRQASGIANTEVSVASDLSALIIDATDTEDFEQADGDAPASEFEALDNNTLLDRIPG